MLLSFFYSSILFCFCELVLELEANTEQFEIEVCQRLFAQGCRHAVIRSRYRSGDCRDGVAVAADGDGVADGILKIRGLVKCSEGNGKRVLARFVKLIRGAHFVERENDVVIIAFHDCADVVL